MSCKSNEIIALIGDGEHKLASLNVFFERMELMRDEFMKAYNEEFKKDLEDRANKCGLTVDDLTRYSISLNIDLEDCMATIERLSETMRINSEATRLPALIFGTPISKLSEFCDTSDDTPNLTDSQIRKMLKYEKNPMRIKQLNQMLSGKKKRRK